MRIRLRRTSLLVSIVAALALATSALGNRKPPENVPQMAEQKRAVHALNRLTFGPRPGDVDRVMAVGVDRWIQQQLHPDKIDDSALDMRLTLYPTLRMSSRELAENFPPQPLIKAIAQGKESFPSDRVKRAIYEAQLDRYEEKQERKQEVQGDAKADSITSIPPQSPALPDDQMTSLWSMEPNPRFQAVLAMSGQQRELLISSLKNQLHEFTDGMTARQRETMEALRNPQQVVTEELVDSKLLRAIYSERQLQEVMTDFWFNHFNVFIGKGADRYLLTSYERDVIRPRALGKFEDLLVATAQSPAMLFYLDNWLSVGPNSDFANGIPKRNANYNWRRPPRPAQMKQAKGRRSGLNENYGRELMELHTLGVNGGYTQKDVTEVARVLTGWTLKQPREGGGFVFEDRMHEPGDKRVLGHRIKSSGEKEGREVLHILAHHPSTAKFISTKLAMRFVSDDPPPTLVDRMSQTFQKKNGDISEVLKTM